MLGHIWHISSHLVRFWREKSEKRQSRQSFAGVGVTTMLAINGRMEFRFKKDTSSQQQALVLSQLRAHFIDVAGGLLDDIPTMPNGAHYLALHLPQDKTQAKTLVQSVRELLRTEGSIDQNSVVYSPLL